MIYPPLFYTAKRQNISELSFLFILYASTFKSTDSLSSTGDTVKVNENQQQARLEDKATGRLSHCHKKIDFQDHLSSFPPGAPPARVLTSSSLPCWLQGVVERGDLLLAN